MNCRPWPRLAAAFCVLALLACDEVDGPIVVGSTLRIAWPPANATVRDSAIVAAAIFTSASPAPDATFSASLDGGPSILGIRQDSVVLFPLEVTADGNHTLTVESSTGATAQHTFSRSYAGPRIHDVEPDSARLGFGQTVVIRGARFTTNTLDLRVYLNGISLPISLATTDSLRVTVQISNEQLRFGLISVQVAGRISPDLVPFRIVGSTGAVAPQIFVVIPSSGPSFVPIAIGGANFEAGATPFVGGMPGVPLFNFETRTLPLIGQISIAYTLVPPTAPRGQGVVEVEVTGRRSNPFPFTKN